MSGTCAPVLRRLAVLAAVAMGLAWPVSPAAGQTGRANRVESYPPDALGPDVRERASAAGGGVAGVEYAEDFELFTPGNLDNQFGWDIQGNDSIITDQSPLAGKLSARHYSDATGTGLFVMISPAFPGGTQFGRVGVEVLINDDDSTYQVVPQDLVGGGQFFNTRVQFHTSGAIQVAQVNEDMTGFVFVETGETWAAGTVMRICVEVVDAAGVLNVYKDGTIIFTGEDVYTGLGQVSHGMGRLRIFVIQNGMGTPDGSGDTITIDTISSLCADEVVGACCLADLTCVEVSATSCAAMSGAYQGDAVPCPQVSCVPPPGEGACCMADGSCSVLTQEACQAASGEYEGDDTLCGQVNCPKPGTCPGDTNTDGEVDVQDLVEVILSWDTADPVADINGDGTVDVQDLVEVILNWGPCPGAPLEGACCLPTGACVQTSSAGCLAKGGEYGGDFTDCGGAVRCEPACPGDTNGDGEVDVQDLVAVILAWDTANPVADLNGDGVVDVQDLVDLILAWGVCD